MADKTFVCVKCGACTHPVGECSLTINSWLCCQECYDTSLSLVPVVADQTADAREGPKYKLKEPPKLSLKNLENDITPDAGDKE
mgnify:FL=1